MLGKIMSGKTESAGAGAGTGTSASTLMGEFLQSRAPEKEIIEKIFEPSVLTKQINEKYKSFDTLYLREHDMKNLFNILTNFKHRTELFDEYGLPNKLGIMLYGLPGTGKTTTIHAIASFLQKNIYYVNLSTVETNEELQLIFDHVVLQASGGGIIVFEDIDAMTDVVHERKVGVIHTKLTLEYFLNLLQGSLTRDGTIFIATTNHLEMLDPAFYRVGRFDVKINMKMCDHYQIKKIYSKFVGKHIDPDILKQIKEDKYTPADIIFHLVNYIDSDQSCEDIMEFFINN
jgi:SpoVK/Ycf46/Vps4 family AAA+-type ATPase